MEPEHAAKMSKVALVTGASSGIGEATVRRLMRAGWRVALAARREDRLVSLAREVDPVGDRTLVLTGDVTEADARARWVAAVLERWGRLDALVNNAGYGQRGPVELVSVDAVRRNFEVNLFALIGLTQLVIPIMREQGGGRIINVGSVAGRIARPMSSVYDATKHALNAISDGLRGEVRRFGIDVVVIQPGMIVTGFIDAANRASTDIIENPGLYAEAVATFREGYARVCKIAGVPDDIARLIERALTVRRPRTRYSGPRHAKVFLFVRWLLPDRLFDKVFGG